MGRRDSISVFMPAHNEAMNLEGAVLDVVAAAEERFEDYEILIVDDGSTDGTGEVADRLTREHPRIGVIHNTGKQGIAYGYRTALAQATKEYFAFLPGDREVHAASVQAIFRAVGTADLVVPYHQNREARAWYRRVMTSVCTALLNALFAQRLRYYQGPAVYATSLARQLPTTTRGFFFLTEMLVHALRRGCTYVEVGLIHQERAYGRSKAVGLSNIVVALQTILGLWWRVCVRKASPVAQTPGLDEPDANRGALLDTRMKR